MSSMYRIDNITEWEEDESLMHGDASHEGWRAVQRLLEDEKVKKIDKEEAKGLPFVCEAESEEEALEKYNAKYCDLDYLKATECEGDFVEPYTVTLQVDCKVEVKVFAVDAEEARELAEKADYQKKDLEIIEPHCVNAFNEETQEYTKLC